MPPWEKYQKQGPWAKYAQPSVAEDVVKAGASGFARGALDLVGLPGSIQDAGQWALRKGYELVAGEPPSPDGGAVERFFAGPSQEVSQKLIGGGGNTLSGSNLKTAASALTGGATDYQPQTTAGAYARTAGEFAPAAIAGPGGVLRKAAMTAVPAAISETAGQLTEGTAAEPWARAGGALAGGIMAAGRFNPAREAARTAPSREALKQQTDALYQTLRDAGIKYDANAFNRTVQKATDDLLKAGLRPSVAKEAFGLLEDLKANIGMSPDFDDINGLVQMVGSAARSADGPLRKAFNIIRDNLDDFEKTAPLITNRPLPQKALNELRTAARQTALKNIKARALEEVLQNADTYQSGVEAGIRNVISNLLRSKRGRQLFSGPERTALLQVAQGRKSLRTLSRFGFDLTSIGGNASFIPTVGAIGAGAAGGPLAGAALATAGTAAKALSPRLTQRAFEQAAGAIRSGALATPSGIQRTQQLRNQQILRRLLSAPMSYAGIQAAEGQ